MPEDYKPTVLPREEPKGQQSQGLPGIQLPTKEQIAAFPEVAKADAKALNEKIRAQLQAKEQEQK
jgi:hypothetical protein